MPAEEHVRLPDGLFLLESLPSSMLALGIAYQSLPARESEANREHAALQASQSPSTAFVYANSLLIVTQNNLIALRSLTRFSGQFTCRHHAASAAAAGLLSYSTGLRSPIEV